MVNSAIHILHDPDGTPVGNAAFDLSREQLAAAAHAAAVVRLERHQNADLDTDAVLALRELTAICDELDRLKEGHGHATVLFSLARLVALHDALLEFSDSRHAADLLREEDALALPLVDTLLAPMEELRAEGVQTVLGAPPVASEQ